MDAVTGLRIVADRMRGRGHQVVEVPGWQTRGRGGPIRPSGAVNHWTAGPRTGDAPSLRICTFGRAGLRNALCSTYSSRHPRLYIVAARQAWHAGVGWWPGLDGNRELGHEAESSGPGDWAPGQLELITDLDLIQADVFGFPIGHIIDHFEWATPRGRKVDRHDVGGPPWRARLEAAQMRTPAQVIVVPTEHFGDVDRDWDRALGTVLADTYGLDLLETEDGIRFTSLIHGGAAKPTDWAGVVGAARYHVDVNPPGARIAGGTAKDTARVVAEFLQAHPKSSWRREGRPF